METAENMASAFEGEAGTAPVVNVSGVDAPTVTTTEPVSNQKFYTEDDLAKVRSQEKSKLYPEIDSLKEELNSLRKEKEEEAARIREAEESELDAKSYAELKTRELQEQLERERQERERAFALLEREKTYADLQAYRQQVLETERDAIIPELVDLIAGNTREEISASVESLKERSAKILESAQSAMQNARKEMTGTRATLPPAGPLETSSEQRNFTPQGIAAMSQNEYAKYRDRLLSPTARGKNSGMFGQ